MMFLYYQGDVIEDAIYKDLNAISFSGIWGYVWPALSIQICGYILINYYFLLSWSQQISLKV